MERSPLLDRAIGGIEMVAAALLAVVTVLMFVSVFLRYVFAWAIPDSHDVGCLLLGCLIFWGMAGAGYRGEHITVDLLWSACSPRLRRALDLFAGTVSLAAMGTFAWMMGTKVASTMADGVVTYDTQMPVWPFYLVAWMGLAVSVLLSLARMARVAAGVQAAEPAAPISAVE